MMLIDPEMGCFEISEIKYKKLDILSQIFENVSITWYPLPDKIFFDTGK